MISKRLMQRRYKQKRSGPEISLTPLVDTSLTLLTIFMITVPVVHNAIKVDLPQGKVQESKEQPRETIVSIDHEGNIYINETKVPKSQLIKSLKEVLPKSQNWIRVNGDRNINYGDLIEIVDLVKSLETIEHVALSTKKI